MVRSAHETKSRILNAAYALFWKYGFVRASLDDIAEQADITKRTLYQHFRSKDDLMAAVLTQASELATQRLQRYFDRAPEAADVILDSLFTQLAKWWAAPRFTGAGFTRVAIELADLPGHPARAVARRHKKMVEDYIGEILHRACVPSTAEKAREIMLVWEGGLTLALIHGDRNYILVAGEVAKRLLNGEGGPAPSRSTLTPPGAKRATIRQ